MTCNLKIKKQFSDEKRRKLLDKHFFLQHLFLDELCKYIEASEINIFFQNFYGSFVISRVTNLCVFLSFVFTVEFG